MKRISLLVFLFLLIPLFTLAEITYPYTIDEKPRVVFGDSVEIEVGDKVYYGLENYVQDYKNGYAHFSFTYTHHRCCYASYPPLVYVTLENPVESNQLSKEKWSFVAYNLTVQWGDYGNETGLYSYDIQFDEGGYRVIVKLSGDIEISNEYWEIPNLKNTDWVSIANRYPTWGEPSINSMSFTPVLVKENLNTSLIPVLIIPGIVGSELYNEDELVWPNLTKLMLPDDHFLTENLSLDEQGNAIVSSVYPKKVIEKVSNLPLVSVNIFEDLKLSLIDKANYTLEANLFMFPYDWRLDLDTTKDLLHQKIEQIKNETGSNKIDIVAHSMGGLLTKNYIDSYGEESINKLIFVGTPHLGASKAGKVLLEGDSFSIPVLEKDRIKEIALNSPALHQLLPVQKYFDEYSGYLRKYKMFGQNPILNYSETKEFFIDEKNKNSYMFELAQNLENKKLYEKSFSGVDVYNIAGCKTATQDAYGMSILGRIGQTRYSSGDGTVPLVSADYIYIDNGNKFYVKDGDHAKLPSTNGVRELILSILKNDSVGVHSNISNNKDFCDFKGKSLSWHSPVEVHIYDSFGNHTGPIDGGIEYGIVGVDYEIIGEEKFIFIPTNNNEEYLVEAIGTDNGTFDLKISDILNGEYIKTKIYNDIQVNTNTEVKFTISEEENESIILGEDNEFYEIGFSSEIIGDGVEDLVPPETDAKVSVVINKKPKKSGLHFILRSGDVGTGVLGSYYSLDDGNNFYIYEEPIPITKDFRSILYYSIDRAGNNEDIKRMDLKSYVISNCKKDNKCIDVVFKHKKLTDVGNIKKIELIKSKFIKFKK